MLDLGVLLHFLDLEAVATGLCILQVFNLVNVRSERFIYVSAFAFRGPSVLSGSGLLLVSSLSSISLYFPSLVRSFYELRCLFSLQDSKFLMVTVKMFRKLLLSWLLN